jgi:hypothetical protein
MRPVESGSSELFRMCREVCIFKFRLFSVAFFIEKTLSLAPEQLYFSSRVFLCVCSRGLEGTSEDSLGLVAPPEPAPPCFHFALDGNTLQSKASVPGRTISAASREHLPPRKGMDQTTAIRKATLAGSLTAPHLNCTVQVIEMKSLWPLPQLPARMAR